MKDTESPRLLHKSHLNPRKRSPSDMDMAFSLLQLIVAPLILPLLPPATVHFLTENDRPVLEEDVGTSFSDYDDPKATLES